MSMTTRFGTQDFGWDQLFDSDLHHSQEVWNQQHKIPLYLIYKNGLAFQSNSLYVPPSTQKISICLVVFWLPRFSSFSFFSSLTLLYLHMHCSFSLTVSFSLSLSHTHTHKYTHTYTHTHTLSLLTVFH